MSTEIATTPIDTAQVAQYHSDGFLVVRQVFSVERIAELDAEAQQVQARSSRGNREETEMPSPERPERDEKPGAARVLSPLYRERLFALIDGAPFVRHMGMHITDLAWGRATFEMTPAEFRLQPLGVVHGGNIATLIDSATFWACYLSMGSDEDGLASVDLKLNYLAPARVEVLRSTGTLIKAGKTLSYAEADVRTSDGRLVAHGTSTLMRLPDLGVKLGIPLWAE